MLVQQPSTLGQERLVLKIRTRVSRSVNRIFRLALDISCCCIFVENGPYAWSASDASFHLVSATCFYDQEITTRSTASSSPPRPFNEL